MDVHVESRRHEVLTQRTKIAKRPPPYTQGIPDPSHVGELAELDACGRSGAQAARLAVTLVVRVAALKPRDLRVALVRQDVRRDAVEEPPVVAHNEHAAGKVVNRLLEASQRVNVQVVGRLVQQQQVSALLERLGQVQAVALAARQVADGLALVVALKVVPRAVGAGRHLATVEVDFVTTVSNLFKERLVGIQCFTRLVDIHRHHCVAQAQLAAVRRHLAHDHAEEGGLSSAVATNDANDGAGRHAEANVIEQHAVIERLGQPRGLNYNVAQAGADRDGDAVHV
mmetsp:Transcript_38442/g.114038  ORF Transcript_38442/g.114038 Transcript_38442/m.114038 type:complete len:284 (+) Transcript_38442:546-1397(+)